MRSTRRFLLLITATLLIADANLSCTTGGANNALTSTDVLAVGAGISGLSAALGAARGSASVTVPDISSVFGGHAVMSEGGVSIVGTPLQHSSGIQDSAELASPKILFPATLKQSGATYWSIFDEQTKPSFRVAGTGWGDFGTIQRLIFDNPELMKTASSIRGLAHATGLFDVALLESLRRYNELVEKGDDTDFGRFGPSIRRFAGQTIPALTQQRRIEQERLIRAGRRRV